MSNENAGSGPVATATPGSPIHVNVSLPSSKTDDEPKAAKSPKAERAPKTADDRERQRDKGTKRALKALGIPEAERDGLLKEIKETRAAKSVIEKLSGEHKSRAERAEAELKLLKDQMATYEGLAKTYADEQFNALPEPMQKFIAATAGDSLDARLKAIKTAKESGLISTKEAAAATAQVRSEANPARPANTSNATNPKAPPANAGLSPKQQWQQLKEVNPRLAAQFYANNAYAIDNDWS